MSVRTYFKGLYHGVFADAVDWYKDNQIYVNLKIYASGDSISRPQKEKSFLVETDNIESFAFHADSIVNMLMKTDEKRDIDGKLIPISIKCPVLHWFHQID